VAVIDTGVDINHPVLTSVLLPGYDFTRNQPGASEWLDVTGMQSGYVDTNTQNQQPGYVQQSTAAVLDQSTAAVLDGSPYAAFGHGTMTSGLVPLVAPQAKILPLKAFSSDGTGYLSNIVAALYYAVQHHANVVNMSFDLTSSSSALNQAVSYANKAGVVLVAAAGNESTSAPVYPAALNGSVVASPPPPIGTAALLSQTTALRTSGSPLPEKTSSAPSPAELMRALPELPSAPNRRGTVSLLLSAKSQSLNQSQASSALSHGRTLTPDSIKGVSMPIRQSLPG